MDSADAAPRSLVRRALPWIGVGALLLLLIAAALAPGPQRPQPHSVCRRHAIGPVGAALTGPSGPWPESWAQLLAAPSSAPLGMEGTMVLRCPEDPATGDPLAEPSFVLVPGLDRDMPPQLVACYERACFHIRREGGTTAYALQYFVTLSGDVHYHALQVPAGADAQAVRDAVQRALEAVVAVDRRGIALAGRRDALAQGDSGVLQQWREALADGSRLGYRRRLCAAWAAGAAGNRALVPVLASALQREPDPQVREELARALALLGDRSGLALLLAVFESPPGIRGNGPGEPAADAERRARAHAGLVALAGTDHGGLFDPGAPAAWKAWAAGRKARGK